MNKRFTTICTLLLVGATAYSIRVPEHTDRIVTRVLDSVTVPTTSNRPIPSYLEAPLPSPYQYNAPTTQEQGILSTNNIIDATNKERIKAGLAPLVMNQKLENSAIIKTQDMIKRQYFEHVSPSGESVSDLGSRVGYDYIVMGENLALGNFEGGDDVVQAWMDSPGHRANILNANYQEIGVYAQKGVYQGREVWFAVQHFGTTRNNCPTITSTLKITIDQLNAELRQQQALISAEKNILESPDRPTGEEYQDRVTAFNTMVTDYNTKLVISQEKIKQYNAQVSAFNTCLLKYQTK